MILYVKQIKEMTCNVDEEEYEDVHEIHIYIEYLAASF